MKAPALALVVLLSFAAVDAGADQEQLASAKTLYESAAYEAALAQLNAIQDHDQLDVVDTYRALCFLGLGRTRDAERALELIVTRKPLMMLDEAEYSPRIVTLFRDVRKRALPQTAHQLYLLAKADYDVKNYESAASGFKQTLDIIADVEPKEQAALTDLRQLADGFLTLAESRVVKPPPAVAVAVPVPAPVPSLVAPTQPAAVNQLFTLADVGITAPAIIDQRLPPWNFKLGAFDRTFKGRLEITIDETGAVEDAKVVESVWGPYDAQLIQAARKWRYQPAVKDGKPVRFRRILDINIDPTQKPTR